MQAKDFLFVSFYNCLLLALFKEQYNEKPKKSCSKFKKTGTHTAQ
jgi:hypothetical protein